MRESAAVRRRAVWSMVAILVALVLGVAAGGRLVTDLFIDWLRPDVSLGWTLEAIEEDGRLLILAVEAGGCDPPVDRVAALAYDDAVVIEVIGKGEFSLPFTPSNDFDDEICAAQPDLVRVDVELGSSLSARTLHGCSASECLPPDPRLPPASEPVARVGAEYRESS